MKDDLGDRMKMYENRYTSTTLESELYIYARVDGRGFSKFTKGMDRPYDLVMSMIMQNTAKSLLEKTAADFAYTQSDEISILWKTSNMFSNKIQKLASILGSTTTVLFIRNLLDTKYSDKIKDLPHFDARVFTLPSIEESRNAFLWRRQDATKNSISMAARSCFSHNSLQNKSGADMIEMLSESGVDYNEYPDFFKYGTFFYKMPVESKLPDEIWNKIPENKRQNINRTYMRNEIFSSHPKNYEDFKQLMVDI